MSPGRSITLATLVAAVALAACSCSTTSTRRSGPVIDNGAVTATAAQPAPSVKTAGMGVDTIELNGLVVHTGLPRRYNGSYCCTQVPGNVAAVFEVSVFNHTTTPYDVSAMTVQASFGSHGARGEPIFSGENNITSPTGIVPPGREYTFTVGYGITAADMTSVDVVITPTYASPDLAIFRGAIK